MTNSIFSSNGTRNPNGTPSENTTSMQGRKIDIRDKILDLLSDNQVAGSKDLAERLGSKEADLVLVIKQINHKRHGSIIISPGDGNNFQTYKIERIQGMQVQKFLKSGGFTAMLEQEELARKQIELAKEDIIQQKNEQMALTQTLVDKYNKVKNESFWTWIIAIFALVIAVISFFRSA